MNGETFQICAVIIAAKQALRSNSSIRYESAKYENSVKFSFLPSGVLKLKREARSVEEWFERAKKLGLKEVELGAPTSLSSRDRARLGFSNASENAIVCFYEDRASFFTPHWKFDFDKNAWDIGYEERAWQSEPPCKKRNFTDNTGKFKATLADIAKFAREIECGHFAEAFYRAIAALEGNDASEKRSNAPASEYKKLLNAPLMPERNLALFTAAGAADVFGAMGSWNDEPPYLASQKGLADEYERLSSELFTQMRLAILYAVNEW